MDVPVLIAKSGRISGDETWIGDVLITGDITIGAGATLTIAPGSRVSFAADSDDQSSGEAVGLCEITVFGTLNAAGTAQEPITFTSSSQTPAPGDWHWILVGGECTMEACRISYGVHGIRADQASPRIRNCRVADCLYNGIWASGYSDPQIRNTAVYDCGANGIRIVTSTGLVQGDSIYNCGENGVLLEFSSSPELRDLYVAENTGAGIYLYAHCSPGITDCHIEANEDDGIFGQWDCSASVDSCYISGNGGSGVYFTDQCKGSVRSTEISANAFYGVFLRGLNSTVFTDNTIASNLGYGVYCWQNAEPAFGDLSNVPTSDDGGNSIYDNDGYQFYNETVKAIKAENNWWGSADSLEIESRIWDGTDNASLGLVDFEPYKTAP
jgi:hypothetical protein